MCGIAGILCRQGKVPVIQIQKMTSLLRHRGPDDEGYLWWPELSDQPILAGGEDTPPAVWQSRLPYSPQVHIEEARSQSAQILLGHRRLGILDLTETGHQPMGNPQKTLWILHNGEVYNFPEIRDQLRTLGYPFLSDTDTEVILYAYQEWGEECLHRFNGMWAFVLWDAQKGELFAARDRFGVKPFYYFFNSDYLLFASEIKALLISGLIPSEPNHPLIYDYLVYGLTDHTPETLFKGINSLPAGHWLRLNLKKWKLVLQRYYQIPFVSSPTSYSPSPFQSPEEEAKQKLRSLLQEAVATRLISDVPVGTCLSGGLDSSSIACLLHHLTPDKNLRCPDYQRTFSVIYEDDRLDETPYIDQVVAQIQSQHYYTTVTPKDLLQDLDAFIWHQEEPFDKVGVYAQWHIYKLVKATGTKVTIDGQGGDELFGGYLEYFRDYYRALLKRGQLVRLTEELFPFLIRHRCAGLSLILPTWRGIIRRLLQGFAPSASQKGWYFSNFPMPCGLSKDFYLQYWDRFPRSGGYTSLTQKLLVSFSQESIPPSLRISDKNAMAHSVESRFPFLDYRLVEFAFSLPDPFKIRRGETKYLLRRTMEDLLPTPISRRQDKRGFWLVLSDWFRQKPLNSFLQDLFASSSFQQRPYWNSSLCQQEFLQFLRGKPYQGFWRWVNLELWLRLFWDSFPSR